MRKYLENVPALVINGQNFSHDDIHIAGNKIALLKLKKMIDKAILQPNVLIHLEAENDCFFDNDGEGYDLQIICEDNLDNKHMLSIKEVKNINGEKIHIQYIGTCAGFYKDEDAIYYGKSEKFIRETNGNLEAVELPIKYYGTSWVAYLFAGKNDYIE